ncbi:MAG: hypothetical protein GX752_03530 [Clostridium sp.]|nr:hypothetical protein [Clostridium sp.]
MRRREAVTTGITLGSSLAMIISWSLYKSVFWAIIHGFFSWLYVIYYLLVLS